MLRGGMFGRRRSYRVKSTLAKEVMRRYNNLMEKVIENLISIKSTIARVAAGVGRDPDGIEIVAASKFRDAETLRLLASYGGVSAFGENRVQEFLSKYDDALTWDFIGRLQTNKVKYLIGKVRLIQSLDRLPLAEEIERLAAKRGIVQECLVEINSGEEENKGGLMAGEAEAFVDSLAAFPHISVRGLMAVAPQGIPEDELRSCFTKVSDLYSKLKEGRTGFDILSMGMSHDFELAVKCGSTMIRPGRILFD